MLFWSLRGFLRILKIFEKNCRKIGPNLEAKNNPSRLFTQKIDKKKVIPPENRNFHGTPKNFRRKPYKLFYDSLESRVGQKILGRKFFISGGDIFVLRPGPVEVTFFF